MSSNAAAVQSVFVVFIRARFTSGILIPEQKLSLVVYRLRRGSDRGTAMVGSSIVDRTTPSHAVLSRRRFQLFRPLVSILIVCPDFAKKVPVHILRSAHPSELGS